MVAVNQPAEPVKRSFNPKIETRLRREEYNKIEKLADEQKKSKSEVLREAALWYLDNQERLKNQKRFMPSRSPPALRPPLRQR